MTRDVMGRIVNNPWWIVVGVVVSGAVYATSLRGEVQEVSDKIVQLSEFRREITQVRRELDSLRIEQRHMSYTVNEIRFLLLRQTGTAHKAPRGDR